MPTLRAAAGSLIAVLLLQACGGSGSGGGLTGKYSSVNDDALTMELKSGGVAVLTAAGVGATTGTYTVDGEKVIVSMEGQPKLTLILDGACLTDQLSVVGKLCKGGKSGSASNVSTRSVPAVPAGVWTASNADGQFKIEFKPGNTLTLSATPVTGQPDTRDGTFTIDGDVIQATLAQGEPLTLKYVNNAYETTSFGLPLRFVKQ